MCRGPPASEALKDAVLDLASSARAHLTEARALAPRLPRGAAAVLLPGALAGQFLGALERAGFDVFAPGLPAGGVSHLRRAVLVKWHSLRGTY
jgi:NADH dehydrogenase [ubiquinone] 1 alpha subcomplex assembly factor 6